MTSNTSFISCYRKIIDPKSCVDFRCKENVRSNSVSKYEFPRFNRRTVCLSRPCAKISHAFVDLQNTYVFAIITCSDFSLGDIGFAPSRYALSQQRFPSEPSLILRDYNRREEKRDMQGRALQLFRL